MNMQKNVSMERCLHSSICAGRAIAVIAAVGAWLLLATQPAAAQTSYQYTGQPFTLFSCGTNSTNDATTLCAISGQNANTSYTAANFVSATMTFANPLAANLVLADVTSLPGFQLSMNDGQQTLTGASIALVSTDGSGNIIAWRLIRNLGNPANSGIATQNWTFVSDSGTLSCCPPIIVGDLARNSNLPGTWSSGSPTPAAMVASLITVVEGMKIPQQGTSFIDKLRAISNDVTTQNGLACLDLIGFTNQVNAQAGKKITMAQAEQLLAAAASIGSALNCAP
jgi:hypothetical protein